MTRAFLIILILALITLALIPNPENPNGSEWANLPRYEQTEPALLIQALESLGISIPKELLPGLGLITLSILLSWIRQALSGK
jgi:hypothetical protein